MSYDNDIQETRGNNQDKNSGVKYKWSGNHKTEQIFIICLNQNEILWSEANRTRLSNPMEKLSRR